MSALDRNNYSPFAWTRADLGASKRARQYNRLHRALNAEPALMFNHITRFDWLIPHVDWMVYVTAQVFSDISKRPCLSLMKTASPLEEIYEKSVCCSLFSHCAFHQAQRDLVTANIWIATSASLVYTRSPTNQS